MQIDCISDLHGHYPKTPGGDILILCGDYTASDKMTQWAEFFSWFKNQDYKKKILIAGNHDNFFMSGWPKNQKEASELASVQEWLEKVDDEFEAPDFEYLCDSGCEVVTNGNRLKIWGTPWTLKFPGINPRCCAFTLNSEEEMKEKLDLIPDDIDILISHSPPYGILDKNTQGKHCGSKALLETIHRVKPKYHFFGHIHEQGNKSMIYKHSDTHTFCSNRSFVNERYIPIYNFLFKESEP